MVVLGNYLCPIVVCGLTLCAMLSARSDGCYAGGMSPPISYAHCPYVKQIVEANHTAVVRTVAMVTTSSACLAAKSMVRTGETPVPPVAEDCASYSNNMIYPLLKGTLS